MGGGGTTQHPIARRVLLGLAVGLTLSAAVFGTFGLTLPRASAGTPGGPTPAAFTSLDWEFYDFFNVPFGEFWDYRTAVYGDAPINAECFNASAIENGLCTPRDPNVRDVAAYPYTSWYPSPGDLAPGQANNNPFLYSAYRFRATGAGVTGYSLAEPVFLPVLDYSKPAGTKLSFDWRLQYLDTELTDALAARGCAISTIDLDGFHTRSLITLTMDLAESKRLFKVVANTAEEAQTWWNSNTDPHCFLRGPAETSLQNWFVQMGGSQVVVGKYDIANSFEWYYQPYVTDMRATVAANGDTTVSIEHVAFGTEVILARMFYWGNTSYKDWYLDSTKATGWWGMELAWFEGMSFTGSLAASTMNFQLASAMNYHFWQQSAPGPDGRFDQVDDVPYWQWGPVLSDYTNDWSTRHLISELDRYPNPPFSYMHTTPGSMQYGVNRTYDVVPHVWNPKAGETWHFQFPTGNVVFYDPNLTPKGANPTLGAFVEIRRPLDFRYVRPAGFGTWDATAKTWHVVGPLNTGGPNGSPGNYPLWMAPEIGLGMGAALAPSLMRITTSIDIHPTWGVPGKIIIDGVPRDEWGLNWMEMVAGPHAISFTDLTNLRTPGAVSVVSAAGGVTTVNGEYGARGWLRVVTDPPVPGTISVNGVARNEWSVWMAVNPGMYTVSFGPVQDFRPPGPQTVEVRAEQLTLVTGSYVWDGASPGPDPATYGLLRVTTRLSDGTPGVPTQIELDGIPRDEWALTWLKLPAGAYTLSYSDVWNYGTPGPRRVMVSAGQVTAVEGVFDVHGWLRVITDPPVPATIHVNGEPRNAWGTWQSMPAGTYTISFGAVPGFQAPAPQTAIVTSWALTTVTGVYARTASAPASSSEAAKG